VNKATGRCEDPAWPVPCPGGGPRRQGGCASPVRQPNPRGTGRCVRLGSHWQVLQAWCKHSNTSRGPAMLPWHHRCMTVCSWSAPPSRRLQGPVVKPAIVGGHAAPKGRRAERGSSCICCICGLRDRDSVQCMPGAGRWCQKIAQHNGHAGTRTWHLSALVLGMDLINTTAVSAADDAAGLAPGVPLHTGAAAAALAAGCSAALSPALPGLPGCRCCPGARACGHASCTLVVACSRTARGCSTSA